MMSHNLVWADLAAEEYQTRINRAERDGWKLHQRGEIDLNRMGLVAPSLFSRLVTAVEAVFAAKKSRMEESKECCA